MENLIKGHWYKCCDTDFIKFDKSEPQSGYSQISYTEIISGTKHAFRVDYIANKEMEKTIRENPIHESELQKYLPYQANTNYEIY
jgi:hypothetical protein